MSSAALTTTHLPQFRTILDAWDAKQKPLKGFTTPLPDPSERLSRADDAPDGKDVLVAFRTRPPLENEASDKFGPAPGAADAEDAPPAEGELAPKVEYCRGISIASAEPGAFVAHVPGMKVRLLLVTL